MFFRDIGSAVLNIVFPEICLFCGCTCTHSVSKFTFSICPDCFKQLPLRPSFFYSSVVPPDDLMFCSALFCPLFYLNAVPQAIAEHKFRGARHFAPMWGALIAEMLFRQNMFGRIDLIVPVPLHPIRQKSRGYNQARDIAFFISKLTSIPLCENALIRLHNTVPQSTLDRRRRIMSDEHTFAADRALLYEKRLLLVDDVITTGSTLERCGKACASAGSANIFYAAAATGRSQ